MHYYDQFHEPSTHLQLTRRSELELLRAAERREIRPGLLERLRAMLRGAEPARPAEALDEVIRELRAVRQRLEALEARVQRPHY